MGEKRDIIIDIMEGILMLLVVSCHAQGPGHRLIYLFHMACFFMISSYLWEDRKGVKIDSALHKTKSHHPLYTLCRL